MEDSLNLVVISPIGQALLGAAGVFLLVSVAAITLRESSPGGLAEWRAAQIAIAGGITGICALAAALFLI